MRQNILRLCAVLGVLLSFNAAAIPEGPTYPSADWVTREQQNYAIVLQAPLEQASSSAFLLQWQTQAAANTASWLARAAADPSWLSPLSGNTPLTPLCTQWTEQCAGNPFRYPGTDPFYNGVGETTPVVFYDAQCARLSGTLWRPSNVPAGATLPAVVIDNGSIEAPQTLYWWAAEMLVSNGYVVMTFDPRGQGRSDEQTPSGTQGGNINVSVFWTGLVDAIDFFRSTPTQTYPNNQSCAGTYPTAVTSFNPYCNLIDRNRLGIAGHSAGAEGVSVVQGYGGTGAAPWPGKIDSSNPVKVAVAWDGLVGPNGQGFGGAGGTLPLPIGATSLATVPLFATRVPSLDLDSEYGLDPVPFTAPPDPEDHKLAYDQWKMVGQPVYTITIQGGTHYEFSTLPNFPTSSWCPNIQNNRCVGGWGQPLAQWYTLAWFDRWLKNPGETGYADADQRLLDDGGPQGSAKMSFYSRSARFFPDRSGAQHDCEDIRAGCADAVASSTVAGPDSAVASGGSSGGALDPWTLLGLAALVRGRRRRNSSPGRFEP